MSTLQHRRRISRPTPGTVLPIAALIIVVAIGAVSLTLNSANHTHTPPRRRTPRHHRPTCRPSKPTTPA